METLTESRRQHIIEAYGLREILGLDINEGFIDELTQGNGKDWEETKELSRRLAAIIPRLIYRIVRLGGRTMVNLMVAGSKRALKEGDDRHAVAKTLFFGLVLALGTLGAGKLAQYYNEKPVIPNTQIAANGDTLEVVDSAKGTKTTYALDDRTGVKVNTVKAGEKEIAAAKPQKEEVKAAPAKTPAKQRSGSQIRLLKPGERTPDYKPSRQILDAIMETESCVLRLYDAKNPNRKLNRRDILNPKVDLTIGYGHKLTREERRKARVGMTITKQQAVAMFRKDAATTAAVLRNAMQRDLPWFDQVHISQEFYDGLFDLTFNMGIGNLAGNNTKQASDVWRTLQRCRIDRKNGCINKSDLAMVIRLVSKQNITEKGHEYRRSKVAKLMSLGFSGKKLGDYSLLSPEYRG